jgi:hypothetical protein
MSEKGMAAGGVSAGAGNVRTKASGANNANDDRLIRQRKRAAMAFMADDVSLFVFILQSFLVPDGGAVGLAVTA